MGIGRREFLKLFGASIAALTTNSSSAIAILDDHYVNRKLGIAFRKPIGWTFASIKDMGAVMEGQIFDFDNCELAREFVDAMELPILTISKDSLSADADQFTPGVSVYLDEYESLGSSPDKRELRIPPLEVMDIEIEFSPKIHKEFCVTHAPKSVRVSECDAAEYTATFMFEHENMQPTRVRMRKLTIEHVTARYLIHMYDSPFADSDMVFDYTSFIDSIRMV